VQNVPPVAQIARRFSTNSSTARRALAPWPRCLRSGPGPTRDTVFALQHRH
jgi:hypothetical protein